VRLYREAPTSLIVMTNKGELLQGNESQDRDITKVRLYGEGKFGIENTLGEALQGSQLFITGTKPMNPL
tara:strand:+ start:191 stop:397 length:207 start_codon:yes stop_codon:yes gene_type:complete